MKKHIRVLIVEDSESDAALEVRALERAGYEVSHKRVEDAEQIKAALKKQAWDVVMVDHSLPQMDSFRALKLLKKSGQDIPVIVVSGAIGEETAVMIMKAGAQDYVIKGNLTRLAPAVERELRDFEILRERKQAEKALRQSEEKYRTVLEEMREGYYEIDLAGNFTLVNAAMCFLLGYSKEELMGTKYRECTPEEHTKTISEAYSRVHRTGEPVLDLHHEVIRKDGSRGFIETSVFLMRNEKGENIGFRGIGRDITERKKVEDERRDMERKAQLASRLSTVGQMAAGICHEINNPLTTIVGYSDLLSNKDLPEDIKQQMGYIREAGHRVADIVRQLLVFARNMQPTRTMIDINYIVSGTLRLREYQLRLANINVLTELAPNLPYILADPGQLQQVFLNIILNAEAEMKLAHGKGTLLVKTECIDDAIRISFKDDGPGISAENLSNIFDPFFTTRRIGEGTGLGLSVCHGIISEHNGRIYAQSKPDKGATFIVELPIVSEFASAEIPGATDKEIQQVCTRRGSVLIVDDDLLLLKFLEQFLTTKGHDVDAVNNANDALKVFTNKKYDLILMDILMPDVSGIELYEKLQRMDKSIDSRLLIMTGDILGKPTRTFLNMTGVLYIEKPFEPNALMTKIDEIMSQNQ
ncbi:MAG: response regulator [Dehalococcoidia bacterium]